MMDLFTLLISLLFIIYALLLIGTHRHQWWWMWSIGVIIATPLLVKVGLGGGTYLHPSFALLLVFALIALCFYFRSATSQVKGLLSSRYKYVAWSIILWVGVMMIGVMTAWLRWASVDVSEILRLVLYAVGFGALFIGYVAARNLLPRFGSHIVRGYILAALLFGLLGISRIAGYVIDGGSIDFWEYGPQHQALSTLSQYVDSTGLHLIISGAAENAGWLLVLGAFMAMVLGKEAWQEQRKLSAVIWLSSAVALTTVMLFTLSRASLLLWFGGIGIIIWWLFERWKQRLVAVLMVIVATISVGLLFPEAPFVQKTLNTAQLQWVEADVANAPQIDNKKRETTEAATATSSASASAKVKHKGNVSLKLEPSSQGRVEYWRQTINIIDEQGWYGLAGLGLVNLLERYDLVTHSLLLYQIVLFGVFGLLAFIGLWGSLIWLGLGWYLKGVDKSLYALAIPLVAMIPGWLISNIIFGGSLLSIELLVVYFGLLGVAMGFDASRKNNP